MNNTNTVCLLNDSFPPLIDGVANTVMNYANFIPCNGYVPIVITPDHPDADDKPYPYDVLRYPSIDIRKKTGYMAGIPFSPEMARQIKSQNVQILHSHCPIVSTMLARQLRQIMDVPLILTYHTKFDIDIENILHNPALRAGSKKILIENIKSCDEVWAVSQGAAENLRSLGYEGECVIMPNGVDFPLGRAGDDQIAAATTGYDLPTNIPVYLFVGRMKWYKGQRIILDALAKLNAAGKNFRMVFIGSGADLSEIQDYAKICGIADKCIFTGAIHDREKLRAWYCRADLFLFPSTYDTNGLVVREAAACSVATVMIRNSCAAEGILDGRNGFMIDENAESLYTRLLSLNDRMDVMHQVGRTAAQEIYISWDTAVKNATERYEIVIERYKNGAYPAHRKPMDVVFGAHGELMEDLGQLLELRDQARKRFKDRWE